MATWAAPQDDAGAKTAARLARQAKRHQDAAKEPWKKFVFGADDMPDTEIKALVAGLEKAIDLYQKALEEHEEPGLNAVILTLTRRVTQARFVLMQRAMRRRIKDKPKPKPERPRETEQPKPEEPEPEDPEAPEEKPPPRRLPDQPLPEMAEPPAQRRRGIQGARNFLMNSYFAPRKFSSMVARCTRCNGAGAYATGRITRDRKVERVPCGSCNRTGYHLNKRNARKGHWLVNSPLYRANREKSDQWQTVLSSWDADPRTIPEFLKTVKIKKVEYHGLWAEITWIEKGNTPERKRFQRARRRKVIRAGRRWFFYDKKLDQEFFTGSAD